MSVISTRSALSHHSNSLLLLQGLPTKNRRKFWPEDCAAIWEHAVGQQSATLITSICLKKTTLLIKQIKSLQFIRPVGYLDG